MTPYFLDTNILLYALSHERAEGSKRSIARRWLARTDWGLSTQVLMEFYVNAIKPRHGLGPALARKAMQRFAESRPVQPLDSELALEAATMQREFMLSLWDAAILCAARRLGAVTVVSEDLTHGELYRGLRVLNPFLEGAAA
jgi:predicted nucleic acid-binding protein